MVSSCRILLIAPWLPRRSWFNDLFSLVYDYPTKLPYRLIFCLKEADYMRIQKCSTYTYGRYQAIPA
ncbi:hypothetical protein DPMN_111041 [Dreissena polymorpha]|uniref:Uncharacterized protein n=1 Tax=Dreissena polymorpha TaxID=45954 RepID=A0A9D4KEA9_DREPO|nr:hypothetical protein DPMN_111041 [Dreissena polymorpha]